MRHDITVKPVPATWELVDERQPLRMLTGAELADLQGFTPKVDIFVGSCPCEPFDKQAKRRIA